MARWRHVPGARVRPDGRLVAALLEVREVDEKQRAEQDAALGRILDVRELQLEAIRVGEHLLAEAAPAFRDHREIAPVSTDGEGPGLHEAACDLEEMLIVLAEHVVARMREREALAHAA